MTRNDIATKLAQQEGMTPSLAAKAVNGMIDIMSEALKGNETIYLRGFGTLGTVTRKPHTGYNFKKGNSIQIPERVAIKFSASNELTKALNSKK